MVNKSVDFIQLTSKNSFNLIDRTKNKFIHGDEDQLNRVIINLIKNSEESFLELSAKDPNFKGNIDIEIDDNNDYIIIRLIDNGTGITDAKKAMTPYFTTKKKGTGLGLSIVNKIVNDHNGNIKFTNIVDGAKIEVIFSKK